MALIRAFREAMNELGVSGTIYGSDITRLSPGFHCVDEGLLVPKVGQIDYTRTIRELVEKHRIGLIVPLTDLDLRALARHRDGFAELGATVMVGDEQMIKVCREKKRLDELLRACGLPHVKTWSLQDFLSEPFYPCFVKPARGSGSVGARVIENEKQLQAHSTMYGQELIVQEYLPGQEYTIDLYRTRGGEVVCVVPRQRLAVRSGEVEHGVTVRDQDLIDGAMRLGAQLGTVWGVCCCQCRRQPNGAPIFFEVNARFGGGVPLSIAAGTNFPLYLLQETLGLPVTAKLGQFTENLVMMRYDDACFVQDPDPATLPGFHNPRFR